MREISSGDRAQNIIDALSVEQFGLMLYNRIKKKKGKRKMLTDAEFDALLDAELIRDADIIEKALLRDEPDYERMSQEDIDAAYERMLEMAKNE